MALKRSYQPTGNASQPRHGTTTYILHIGAKIRCELVNGRLPVCKRRHSACMHASLPTLPYVQAARGFRRATGCLLSISSEQYADRAVRYGSMKLMKCDNCCCLGLGDPAPRSVRRSAGQARSCSATKNHAGAHYLATIAPMQSAYLFR